MGLDWSPDPQVHGPPPQLIGICHGFSFRMSTGGRLIDPFSLDPVRETCRNVHETRFAPNACWEGAFRTLFWHHLFLQIFGTIYSIYMICFIL